MVNDIKEKQPMPFWVINPIILKYSTRYILGTGQDALKLFFKLCNMRVYVDGFVDDELEGMTIYHKKIYGTKQISACEGILLLSSPQNVDLLGIAVCDMPVMINPAMDCSDIYIYGAGMMGRKLLNILSEKDIVVKGFIDSDMTKVNTWISGVKVYGCDILRSLQQETSVIEAGKYYQEIDKDVCRLNKKIGRYYFADTSIWRDNAIWVDQNKIFDGVLFLDNGFGNRKIYLCGKDYELVKRYLEIFLMLDFEKVCVAKWSEFVSEGEEVCCIEDTLLEEDSLIIFCSDSVEDDDLVRLHDLGLERGKDYCDIRCNIWEKEQYVFSSKCRGIQILDLNLAYTRDMGWDFPGIAVCGDNSEQDYKIAVLGGSTSTDGYFCFKSWPSIFFEKFDGRNVTVFNAAVEGYASGQELIKLMRDVILLNPDMVIVYDGYNDITRQARLDLVNIFDFFYMKTIMEYVNVNIEAGTERHRIFCGIPAREKAMETWLKNIEYMHAVCEINNIRFLSFIQPVFYGKPKMNLKRDAVLYKIWDAYHGDASESLKKPIREFRECAPEICKTHEYVYDLSHIFDNEAVYMDICHVFEKGNQIIADEIYKTVKDIMIH